MASLIKDFIGLNILVNDPIEDETNAHGTDTNTFGCVSTTSSYSLNTSSLSESKVLPILLTHRNGPWGYCTWKQMRVGENTITNRQRKNNKLTFVKAATEKVVFQDGKRKIIPFRDPTIQIYDEPAIVSKHQPLMFNLRTSFDGTGTSRPVSLLTEYNNAITYMTNKEVNAHMQIGEIEPESYNDVKQTYLNGALSNPSNAVTAFNSLRFTQTIYPPEKFTFKNFTRTRASYISGYWRTDRANRTEPSASDGFALSDANASIWPLDVGSNWASRTHDLLDDQAAKLNDPAERNTDYGILWNTYSFAHDKSGVAYGINNKMSPACHYSRKHILTNSQSVANPSGRTDLIPASDIPSTEVFGGEAFWDTPLQSGKYPFDDTITDYYEKIRPKYKDYTIVPEFRMEDHIDFYLENGALEDRLNVFKINGGDTNRDDSSKQDFYETYSMSDFLKNFDLIVEDHEDIVKPSVISLTCKAVKKFLPYDGFYPAQRATKIAQTFYDSYKNNITFGDQTNFLGGTSDIDFSAQPLIQPLFAPGVLFNSIKSGVACDFLSFSNTSSMVTRNTNMIDFQSTTGTDVLNRIPFEALIAPEEHLANKQFLLSEFHENCHISMTGSAIWDGHGKQNYKLMIDNFLAAVPQFFLKNKGFTRIVSKEQGNPNFGNVKAGVTYGMRVKMYRSLDSGRGRITTGSISILPPQDVGPARETLTMYSRPSAFGPEYKSSGVSGVFGDFISQNGYNFPWTPPYYHGTAYADIYFTPSETRKYTISEIFNSSSVEYYRLYDPNDVGANGYVNSDANRLAMQLSASVNLFGLADPPGSETAEFTENYTIEGQGLFESDQSLTVVRTIENAEARWAIQTKFECPILNFNSIQTSSMTMPEKGAASVPIGMWHQYGSEPFGNTGVFLQVHNVPLNWRAHKKAAGSDDETRMNNAKKIKSLNRVLGFSNDPVRLGEMANSKLLEEAVVAIPFFDEGGVRKFFPIPKKDIKNAIDGNGRLVGETIIDMVNRMRKYRLPPTFDFLTYTDVDPFAMYIFEFKHRLSRRDLTDIWQNVSPKIGTQHVESSVSITHELLARELMGGGSITAKDAIEGKILDDPAVAKEFNSRVRWLVFKVKRKAKNNYKRKMLQDTGTSSRRNLRDRGVQLDPLGANPNITYNWPHDYYSLVELIKINAEVEFSKIEKDDSTSARGNRDIFARGSDRQEEREDRQSRREEREQDREERQENRRARRRRRRR